MRFSILFWGGWKSRHPNISFSSRHFAGFGASDEDSRFLECWEGVKMRCFFCYLNQDVFLLLESDAMMHVIFLKTWQFSYSFGGCVCLRIWTAIWWNCWWMVANHRSYTRLKESKIRLDCSAFGCWFGVLRDISFGPSLQCPRINLSYLLSFDRPILQYSPNPFLFMATVAYMPIVCFFGN